MKKIIFILCACVLLCAGCAATPETPASTSTAAAQATPEALVLFDTSSIKITLEGAQTIVEDKTTGTQYEFTTARKLTTQQPTLEQLQGRCIARTSTSTDTLEIELAGALIVVHDLAGNQTYYIQH